MIGWRESNRVTPADEAAFRVDFGRWLADLPERKRQMAELLLQGHRTGDVAGMVGVSQGRVSQVRLELEADWRTFQGEAEETGGRGGARPRDQLPMGGRLSSDDQKRSMGTSRVMVVVG